MNELFIFFVALFFVLVVILGLIPAINLAAEARLRRPVLEAGAGDLSTVSDAQRERQDERKITAFTRLAFVFALVTGTQWLASFIRTPIFQEYIGVLQEANAKMYALIITVPIVLLYNFAISALKPQNLVWGLCTVYGFLLLMLSSYLAYLDSWGGKYGLYVFDGDHYGSEPAGALTFLFGPKARNFMFYFLVIVTETRSVVLYGSLMSFLTLYMGTRSKNLSVSVFTFMNFWQQIGMIVFLMSGAAAKFLQIPIGADHDTTNTIMKPGEKMATSRINGSTCLMVLIAICTLLIPFIANPAYDILEKIKQEEEQEDSSMPESAKLGSLQDGSYGTALQDRTAYNDMDSYSRNSNASQGFRSDGNSNGIIRSRMGNRSIAQQARLSAAEATAQDDGIDDDVILNLDGQEIEENSDEEHNVARPLLNDSSQTAQVNLQMQQQTNSNIQQQSNQYYGARSSALQAIAEDEEDLISRHGQKMNNITNGLTTLGTYNTMSSIGEMVKVDTPPPDDENNNAGTRGGPGGSSRSSGAAVGIPPHAKQQLQRRMGANTQSMPSQMGFDDTNVEDTNEDVSISKAGQYNRGNKVGFSDGQNLYSMSSQIESDRKSGRANGIQSPRDSWSQKASKAMYTMLEGLFLLCSHRFIFLLFICQYAHLPVRQLIEIQMGFLLGTWFAESPDTMIELQPPQSSRSDEKLQLLTVLGLVAGVLNATLNWAVTKDLVQNMGNRFALLLNPLFGACCLAVFCLSYTLQERDGYASIQFNNNDWIPVTRTQIPWNDNGFRAGWSGNILEHPQKTFFLCESRLSHFTQSSFYVYEKPIDGVKGGAAPSSCTEDVSADFEKEHSLEKVIASLGFPKDGTVAVNSFASGSTNQGGPQSAVTNPNGSAATAGLNSNTASLTKALFIYNWQQNLHVDENANDEKAVNLFNSDLTARYHAFLPKEETAKGISAKFLKHQDKSKTVSASGLSKHECKAVCVENWRECKYLYWVPNGQTVTTAAPGTTTSVSTSGESGHDATTNGATNMAETANAGDPLGDCSLFTKILVTSNATGPKQKPVLGAKSDAKSLVIRGRHTFAEIAKSVQDASGIQKAVGPTADPSMPAQIGLLFLIERRVDIVSDKSKDGADIKDLHILTGVMETKDYIKNHKNVTGLSRDGASKVDSNMWPNNLLSPSNRYILVAFFWVLWSSVTFAVCNPIINVITLRTAPKVKVKAKSWSNSFGNNLLKLLGYTANTMNIPVFMLMGTATFGGSWIIFWIISVFWLTGIHDQLERDNEYVGADIVED